MADINKLGQDTIYRLSEGCRIHQGICQPTSGKTYAVHSALNGITRIMAGIISAIGNILTFIIRNPVASMINPPHALKSLIISGVVSGKITPAMKNRRRNIINCGMAMIATTIPSVHAKIRAVNKSNIDFDKRML